MASLSEADSDSGVDEELTRDLQSLNELLEGDTTVGGLDNQDDISRDSADKNLERLLSCLHTNQGLQSFLQEQLEKVDAALLVNKQKVDCLTAPKGVCKRALNKPFTFWSFRRGKYFRDHCGQSAPTHSEDAGGSTSSHQSIPLDLTPWRRGSSERRLLEGVRIQMLEKLSQPLLTKLQTLSIVDREEDAAARKDLEKLKGMSDVELFKDMVPDDINWSSLSYEMFDRERSANDCKLHWTNHLHPTLNKKEWSKEEDKLLVRLAKKHKERDWAKIARELKTNRSAFICLKHYQSAKTCVPGGSKWKVEEDKMLRTGVGLYGDRNWGKVGKHVGGGRSAVQCYQRWIASVCPDLKRGRWSAVEDQKLREGVSVHGTKAWSKVALFVPGRNQSQCRERYLNVLDTTLKKGPWKKEEDQLLMALCKPYEGGPIRWSKVAKEIPHRTDAMCTQRWRQLSSDDDVVQQYKVQVMSKTVVNSGKCQEEGTITKAALEVMEDSVPDAVNKMVEKFKKRYCVDKRSRRQIPILPSPSEVLASDNTRNDLLTSAQMQTLSIVPEDLLTRFIETSVASAVSRSKEPKSTTETQTAVTDNHSTVSSEIIVDSSNVSLDSREEEVGERLSRLLSGFGKSMRGVGHMTEQEDHLTERADLPNQPPQTSRRRGPRKKKAIKSWSKEANGQTHNLVSLSVSSQQSPSAPTLDPSRPRPAITQPELAPPTSLPVSVQSSPATTTSSEQPLDINSQILDLLMSHGISDAMVNKHKRLATRTNVAIETDRQPETPTSTLATSATLPTKTLTLTANDKPHPSSLKGPRPLPASFSCPPGSLPPPSVETNPSSSRSYTPIGASYYRLDEHGKIVKCCSRLPPVPTNRPLTSTSGNRKTSVSSSTTVENTVTSISSVTSTSATMSGSAPTLPVPLLHKDGPFPLSPRYIVQTEETLKSKGYTIIPVSRATLLNTTTSSSLSSSSTCLTSSSTIQTGSTSPLSVTTRQTGLTSSSTIQTGSISPLTVTTTQTGLTSPTSATSTPHTSLSSVTSLMDTINSEFLSFAECVTHQTGPTDFNSPPSNHCPFAPSGPCAEPVHIAHSEPCQPQAKTPSNNTGDLAASTRSGISTSDPKSTLTVSEQTTVSQLTRMAQASASVIASKDTATVDRLTDRPVSSDSSSGLQAMTGGETATGSQVLSEDTEMGKAYEVGLRKVDGVSLISTQRDIDFEINLLDNVAEALDNQLEIIQNIPEQVGPRERDSSPSTLPGPGSVCEVENDHVVSLQTCSNSAQDKDLITNLLRYNPDTRYVSQIEYRRNQLSRYLYELAGFDLPCNCVSEPEKLISADTHVITYTPNTQCHKVKRSYKVPAKTSKKSVKGAESADGADSAGTKKNKPKTTKRTYTKRKGPSKISTTVEEDRPTQVNDVGSVASPVTGEQAVMNIDEKDGSPNDGTTKANPNKRKTQTRKVTKTTPKRKRAVKQSQDKPSDEILNGEKRVSEETGRVKRTATPRKRNRLADNDDDDSVSRDIAQSNTNGNETSSSQKQIKKLDTRQKHATLPAKASRTSTEKSSKQTNNTHLSSPTTGHMTETANDKSAEPLSECFPHKEDAREVTTIISPSEAVKNRRAAKRNRPPSGESEHTTVAKKAKTNAGDFPVVSLRKTRSETAAKRGRKA